MCEREAVYGIFELSVFTTFKKKKLKNCCILIFGKNCITDQSRGCPSGFAMDFNFHVIYKNIFRGRPMTLLAT